MYACVYFQRDATLSVVHEKDKDLTILTKFEKRHFVEMKWRINAQKKETFAGVIVKVGETEEELTKYATKAYNSIVKGVPAGTAVPEELFSFQVSDRTTGRKREHIPSKKLEESKLQEEELQLGTPKKQKKKNQANVVEKTKPFETAAAQPGHKEKTVSVTSLLMQFNDSVQKSKAVPDSTQVAFHNTYKSDITGNDEIQRTGTVNTVTAPMTVQSTVTNECPVPSDHTSNYTQLTSTWSACHGALDLLGQDSSPENPTVDIPPTPLPVASASVVATLRGMASPDFINFIQRLGDHIESSTDTCPHTCLKVIMGGGSTQNYSSVLETESNANQGFLSQLEEESSVNELPHSLYSQRQLVSTPSRVSTLHNMSNQPEILDVPVDKSPWHSPNENLSSLDNVDQTPRRSPRKHGISVVSPMSPENSDQVKLLPTSDLRVGRQALRKACHTASKKKERAAFHLVYQLCSEIFTVEELAESRGLGLSKPKPGDENRPVLDREKVQVLKEYVNTWCKKNLGMTFSSHDLNDGFTERTSYARKQLKKKNSA